MPCDTWHVVGGEHILWKFHYFHLQRSKFKLVYHKPILSIYLSIISTFHNNSELEWWRSLDQRPFRHQESPVQSALWGWPVLSLSLVFAPAAAYQLTNYWWFALLNVYIWFLDFLFIMVFWFMLLKFIFRFKLVITIFACVFSMFRVHVLPYIYGFLTLIAAMVTEGVPEGEARGNSWRSEPSVNINVL